MIPFPKSLHEQNRIAAQLDALAAETSRLPTNGSIFFTIFQTFMSGKDGTPNFGEYPPDYFDAIFIDECHRGGANDEGNWRGILEYFSPAVQIGLTATPKRKDNVDTYKYFGDPVYVYSLKEGINDGFLTPFRVKRIQTTLDDYVYVSDDTVVEGEIEEGKVYEEADFNRIIEIKEREAKRVKVFLNDINQTEKTLVFCANQAHAAAIRELVNQHCLSKDPFYCVRVPVTEFHCLVIPKRHIPDYFALSHPELKASDDLLRQAKQSILAKDNSVTGFNIGMNSGEDAGQTIFHCHAHLIPRRKGDVEKPKGGVRHVIPNMGYY